MNLVSLINKVLALCYPIVKKWMPFEVYAYLAVGATNTVLNIILFTLFYKVILGEPMYIIFSFPLESYTIALLLAFIATIPSGFWLSKKFAFTQAAKQKTRKQLGKYFLVVLQGLLSDYLLFKGLIVFFHMGPVFAKVLSTVVVLTVNYLLQKFFTFKVEKEH